MSQALAGVSCSDRGQCTVSACRRAAASRLYFRAPDRCGPEPGRLAAKPCQRAPWQDRECADGAGICRGHHGVPREPGDMGASERCGPRPGRLAAGPVQANHSKIGDALMAQGDIDGAVAAYRVSWRLMNISVRQTRPWPNGSGIWP